MLMGLHKEWPSLRIDWSHYTRLRPTFNHLFSRIELHSQRFERAAPSGLEWGEVVARVGLLHVPTFLVKAPKEKVTGDGLTKCRALSLYSGRAGISCALKERCFIPR